MVAVLLGVLAGALYTVSPLGAWCATLAAIVLTLAGLGLPISERRALNLLLVAALAVRLAAIGAMFIVNMPMHDDESVGMLSGDEAYGMSRALRARDVATGVPVTQYDYFVTNDEYGRNSYITLLTAIQVLFGPTPYSMRLLNTLLFLIASVLLFRACRSAFGPLPAFGGLAVMLFLPTLFVWSISLLKEPLYLLGTAMIVVGAIEMSRGRTWRARFLFSVMALAGLAMVADLRAGATALAVLGLVCGIAALVFFSSPLRLRVGAVVALVIALFVVMSVPSAQERVTGALESAAKTHAGHVFTVGHSYRLLDEGFYFNAVSAAASTLTLTSAEAARYVVRAAASFLAVPLPWQLASTRELVYLPEQLVWYVLLAFFPVGLVAGWRRERITTALLGAYALPTAAALALTNGNVGTLLRLRGIVIPYVLWLSAVGFCAWLQRMSAANSRGAATT